MKTKTAELTGAALNWAVAKCEGAPEYFLDKPWRTDELLEHYSTDWAQGGPIIERECIYLSRQFNSFMVGREWCASFPSPEKDGSGKYGFGETPLIAAMRCYIADKLGDEVEIPRGLK